MRNKTRKFIWSAPLVAALAIIGALTLAGVLLLPNADTAQAQATPAPTNVQAEAGDTTITVTWGPTADIVAVTGFEVEQKLFSEPDSAYDTTGVSVGGGTNNNATRSAEITSLPNDTAHSVRVRATYASGNSDWVSPSPNSFTPKALPTAGPTALTLTADTYGDTLSASWTASTDTSVTHYLLRYRATASGDWMPSDDGMRVTGTSATLTGLDPSVLYQVQVVAANANGANPFAAYSAGDANAAELSTSATERTRNVAFGGMVSNIDSTSGGAGVNITVTFGSLQGALPTGSSIVLYLEDDYQVNTSIPASAALFTATGAHSRGNDAGGTPVTDASFNYGGVTAEVAPIVKTGAYLDADKKDYAIRVYIPNFCTDGAACGLESGQGLTLLISSASGIKNPTEAGTHSNYVDVLGPTDLLKSSGTIRDAIRYTDENGDVKVHSDYTKMTVAKIGLSSVDGGRGDEITVTGSGFNNGTSAAAYVLDGATNPGCEAIIRTGTRLGSGTVGSDDKVAITFEVTVPTFKPGNVNYICVADGEGRTSATDVEDFELTPSISVSPKTANVGDTVTLFAQDFEPGDTAAATEVVKLANQDVGPGTPATELASGSIGADGSSTQTFVVPGWAEGTLRVDAWGEDTKLTVIGSSLNISKSEALPNELLTITGDGFSTGDTNYVLASMITIDGVALKVHNDSLTVVNGMNVVDVSSSGQFVATVVLWPASGATNPALTSGVHTIKVVDNNRYSGTVTVTVPEPSISVTPGVAGPRDIVTISGENWPIDNLEGDAIDHVSITVDDGNRRRTYSVFPDSAGRFFVEHRVATNVAIPSTNRVTATYSSEVVEIATFEVPAAIIEVTPGEGQPGDVVSLSVDKMPVYASVDRVQIAGRDVLPAGNFSTDRTGSVTVDGVVIPGLDPGTYSILMDVDDTVAIGSLDILSEGPIGTEVPVAEALAELGDSLEAVFYFDNISKTWSFHDPRPEFADLNTLANLVNGEAYWVLVDNDVDDVVLNNKSRSLTCAGGDCWNLVIW